MSRPSFQFYPGDWRKNANLGRCSKAARGAWIDVLCVLHDSDEYGVARYPLRELANASGCPLALLRELVAKGVLKGADSGSTAEAFVYVPRSGRKDGPPVVLLAEQSGPIWYSSRMVKDEHVRQVRGEGSRFGTDDAGAPKGAPSSTPKPSPKPPFGDGSSSSSSSSASAEEKPPNPRKRGRVKVAEGLFERFYAAYPRKVAPESARKAFDRLLPDEGLVDEMVNAIRAQGLAERCARGETQYVPHPATWLNGGRWKDGAGPSGEQLAWHETQSGIRAKGQEIGLGDWDQDAFEHGQGEPFQTYAARVKRATMERAA